MNESPRQHPLGLRSGTGRDSAATASLAVQEQEVVPLVRHFDAQGAAAVWQVKDSVRVAELDLDKVTS